MINTDFASRAQQLLDQATNVNAKINQTLCQEFDMSSDKVSRWFKSLFGITIRDALKQKFEITKQQVENAILASNNVKEMQEILKVSSTSLAWKGLLDKTFGYSTYSSAKASFISRRSVAQYNPNREDNTSLVISQLLGDGHFDTTRRVIRLQHSIKQADYLIFKVSLFNKAYPESSPVTKIVRRTHSQGHDYVDWYSGNFSESTFRKVVSMQPQELFDNLTPLGWCLWYLDDGGYYNYDNYSSVHKLELCVPDASIRLAAIKELQNLSFAPNQNLTSIILQDKIQIALFLSTFVKPFKHIIPECMHYKIDMKI